MTNEVITVQLGHYANHVGSHFWNLQNSNFVYKGPNLSEVNHDALFREGRTLLGEVTFTPRLISVDLKGALGDLPQFGRVYEAPVDLDRAQEEVSCPPDSKVEVIRQEDGDKSDPDKDIDVANRRRNNPKNKFWSDYLITDLHPKSNVIVNEYQAGNELRPFDVFNLKAEINDELEDRIRFFAEECDFLSGFQILTDCVDGFGGVNSDLLDLLSDDYASKCRLTFPCAKAQMNSSEPGVKPAFRLLNTVLTADSSAAKSNAVSPMSLALDAMVLPDRVRKTPGFRLDYDSDHQTAAVLASALDTMSLPWRSSKKGHGGVGMLDVAGSVCNGGRNLASLSVSWMEEEKTLLLPSTDSEGEKDEIYGIFTSHRGDRKIGPNDDDPRMTSSPAYIKLGEYFPEEIFERNRIIKDISASTVWKASLRESGSYVKTLSDAAQKVNLNRMHKFVEAGLEKDDFDEVKERLSSLYDSYVPKFFC